GCAMNSLTIDICEADDPSNHRGLRFATRPAFTTRPACSGNDKRAAEVSPYAKSHTSARARCLLGDRGPAAARASGRRATGLLDHRESRSVGYRQADGASGAARADRAADVAGRAELELARIRHACRGVALLRSVPPPVDPADALDQCARLRGLCARRPGSE